jgi:hypothetical protein
MTDANSNKTRPTGESLDFIPVPDTIASPSQPSAGNLSPLQGSGFFVGRFTQGGADFVRLALIPSFGPPALGDWLSPRWSVDLMKTKDFRLREHKATGVPAEQL